MDASRAPSFLCLSQESRAPKSLGVKDFFRAIWFIHGADAPWLDFCDEHRNRGGDMNALKHGRPKSRQPQIKKRVQLLEVREGFGLPGILMRAFDDEQQVAHLSGLDGQLRQEIYAGGIEELETGQVERHLFVSLMEQTRNQ